MTGVPPGYNSQPLPFMRVGSQKGFSKEPYWKEGPHIRYYVWNHLTKTSIPVEFDFLTTTWGMAQWSKTQGAYKVTAPASDKLGLTILNNKRVDWSKWGPLDGQSEEDKEGNPSGPSFCFNSNQGEDNAPLEEVTTPQIWLCLQVILALLLLRRQPACALLLCAPFCQWIPGVLVHSSW